MQSVVNTLQTNMDHWRQLFIAKGLSRIEYYIHQETAFQSRWIANAWVAAEKLEGKNNQMWGEMKTQCLFMGFEPDGFIFFSM